MREITSRACPFVTATEPEVERLAREVAELRGGAKSPIGLSWRPFVPRSWGREQPRT